MQVWITDTCGRLETKVQVGATLKEIELTHKIPLIGCTRSKNISTIPIIAWGWVGSGLAPVGNIIMNAVMAKITAVI